MDGGNIINSGNKTFDDLFATFASAAKGGAEDEAMQQQQSSWLAPAGFQIKPIWQSVAESILPERVVTVLLLVLIFLKFTFYVTSMLDASSNLQHLVLYRSHFFFVGDSFIRVEGESDNAKQKARAWCLTQPLIMNQLANACIVYSVFFAPENSRAQLYSNVAGASMWFFVNIVWNKWFILFTKPNLAHSYQAKQFCLVNMYFFLSLIMIGFFLMNIEDMGKSRYYSGPMHVVGLGMESQSTSCDSYRRFVPKNESRTRNGFSFSKECFFLEYQAKVNVAWGGKWGCPKLPTKHCQATVDYVQREAGLPNPLFERMCSGRNGCKSLKSQEDLVHWDIYPCNKLRNRTRSQNRFRKNDHQSWNTSFPFEAGSLQNEVCSMNENRDHPAHEVKECLTKAFNNNFDENDFTLKLSVQTIHAAKPHLDHNDALSDFIGDCNTCTVKRKKPRVLTPDIASFASYICAMLFLAGWWLLSMLEKHYGWCDTPLNLGVRPVDGIDFWDFFFLSSSFLA